MNVIHCSGVAGELRVEIISKWFGLLATWMKFSRGCLPLKQKIKIRMNYKHRYNNTSCKLNNILGLLRRCRGLFEIH